MKKIVILSGAGLDKESGIETFRDSKDSLWNNYKVEDVATPKAFLENPGLVLDFYNQRRQQLKTVEPNQAHYDLAALEDYYNVFHITQNVSDLLERAGASNVLHLHGSLTRSKTNMNPEKSYDIGYDDINLGDLDEDGNQLRPDIVWFGESVTCINEAEKTAKKADIFIIVGTSLGVYPAAVLYRHARRTTPIYVIDPNIPEGMIYEDRVSYIQEVATAGVSKLVGELIEKALKDE